MGIQGCDGAVRGMIGDRILDHLCDLTFVQRVEARQVRLPGKPNEEGKAVTVPFLMLTGGKKRFLPFNNSYFLSLEKKKSGRICEKDEFWFGNLSIPEL